MTKKRLLIAVSLLTTLVLVSCTKDDCQCTARAANGDALYEVTGSDVCQNQVNTEEGEYCDCNCN